MSSWQFEALANRAVTSYAAWELTWLTAAHQVFAAYI
jgi:hypothetical protein